LPGLNPSTLNEAEAPLKSLVSKGLQLSTPLKVFGFAPCLNVDGSEFFLTFFLVRKFENDYKEGGKNPIATRPAFRYPLISLSVLS
jgi:hypothetical protein